MPPKSNRKRNLPKFDPTIASKEETLSKTKAWHISKLPSNPTSNNIVTFLRESEGIYLLSRLWVISWLADQYGGIPSATVKAVRALAAAIVPLQMELVENGVKNPVPPKLLFSILKPARRTFAWRVLLDL